MKKVLLLIAFLLCFFTNSIAQQDTLRAVVPYEVFPIGALRYPVADTLEKMFGMNYNWWGFGYADTAVAFNIQTQAINNGGFTVNDPYSRDSNHMARTSNSYYDLLVKGAYGIDIRVFAPGTSGITSEYDYDWGVNTGVKPSSSSVEWKIDTSGLSVGDYVLRLAVDDSTTTPAMDAPYTDGGWGMDYIDTSHVGTWSYEMVYFFTDLQLEDLDSNEPLYSIEYWARPTLGTTSWTVLARDTITSKKYNDLSEAITQAPGHTVDAEKLSTWEGVPKNIRYRIQKRTLDVRSYYRDKGPGDFAYNPQVDVRVRTFKKTPMMFRCLRIRDWVGQRLLTGRADIYLDSAIQNLKQFLNNDQIKSWTIGNEPTYKNYHAWGYINDLLVHRGAPPANVFVLPHDYGQFARIVRDQTQDTAHSQGIHEWTIFTGVGFVSRYMHEGVPQNVIFWGQHHPRAIPSAMSTDSIGLWKHGIAVMGDYGTFTTHTQDTMLGFVRTGNEENKFGDNYQQLKNISVDCYDLVPSRPIPYSLMAQTLVKPVPIPKWRVDSLFLLYKDSILTAIQGNGSIVNKARYADSVSYYWADSIYHATIINPYINRLKAINPDTIFLQMDSLYDYFFEDRNPTPAELYWQLWAGILSGMKSYALNVGYTDGLEQYGFLKDSAGHIMKTDQLTEYRYTTYQLTTPRKYVRQDDYSIHNDSLPPHRYGKNFYQGDSAHRAFIPLLPGYKQLSSNIRKVITEELGPIAQKLSKLLWKGSVSWHKKDSIPLYLSRLPVEGVLSKTLAGSIDSQSKTYVQFGIHQDVTDSLAKYLTVQNRRLWCNETNTDSTDFRRVSFKINTDVFPEEHQDHALWQITDVATNKDTTIYVDSLYTLILKPGQGRLFRIAPAFGLNLGRMSENLFNNGRHVAPVEPPLGAVAAYLTTYQRDGNIVVSYPVETPTGIPSKRNAGNPVDTVIDNSGQCFNPAIAYNQKTNVVGLTYRKVIPNMDTNSLLDTTIILYRRAIAPFPSKFDTCDTVDRFTANRPYFSPPAIMPVNGKDTNTNKDFWIGYNHPTAGGVLTVVKNHTILPKQNFFKSIAAHVQFVSLATHVPNDTVRIAFQEGTPAFSAIYYAEGWINNGVQVTAQAQIKDISTENGLCVNEHPQIAVSEDSTVLVTWESVNIRCIKPGCARREFKHLVFNRTRSPLTGRWSPINQFTAIRDTLDSAFTSTYHTYPNIQAGMFRESSGADEWQDRMRLMWNNEKTGQIAISRHFDLLPGNIVWKEYQMLEPSLEPAMPHASLGKRVLEPMLYRHIPGGEDGLFDARITRYDFPLVGVENTPLTWIRLKSNSILCFSSKKLDGEIGHVAVTRLDSIHKIPMKALPGTDGSTSSDAVLGWDDKRLRTATFHLEEGDSLSFYRHLHIGMFDDGEISDAASELYDSTDYIGIRVRLRKASNDSILLQIDSCRLGMSYFTFSPTNAQQGWRSFSPPISFSDSVYLSMEAFRAIPFNEWDIISGLRFNDDYFEPALPDSNPAYKRTSDNPKPSNYDGDSSTIRLTINPNPFEGSTKVLLDTYKDIPLSVQVYNVLGGLVTTLFNGSSAQEHYQFTLDSRTIRPGTYFVRVQAGNEVVTRKVQFMK